MIQNIAGFVAPTAKFVVCPDKMAGAANQRVIQELAAKGSDLTLADDISRLLSREAQPPRLLELRQRQDSLKPVRCQWMTAYPTNL